MSKYKNIEYMLKTVFSNDFSFSEDDAKSLYLEAIANYRNEYEVELEEAFSDSNISWKNMLLNSGNEVFDAATEDEAKNFVLKMLYEPVFTNV